MIRTVALFLCMLSVFMLCSWVDPNTVDVYTGQILYTDVNGYNVTQLSGDVQYWLNSYSGLAYDNGGAVLNTEVNVKSGTALIGGREYNVRFSSQGGFQIEQTYYTTNNITRTAYINYALYPDELPTGFQLPELGIIFIVFLVFVLIVINMTMRGLIL